LKKDYVICVPKLSNSNGLRVLYRLADALKSRGFNVYLFSVPDEKSEYKYITEISDDLRKNAVVIYPEMIVGNPLKFNNVVRYILYYPNKLMINNFNSEELEFVYDREYSKTGDILYISGLDENIFYEDKNAEKNKNCYFVYKGGEWKEIPEFKNMVKITRKYPKTREELGNLLRETKTLYSYDDCSFILDEAIICGCDVKLVRENGFEDYKSNYFEKIEDSQAQLANFIEKTQNMNNFEVLQKRDFKYAKFYNLYNYVLYKSAYNIFKHFNEKLAQKCWFRAETRLSKNITEGINE